MRPSSRASMQCLLPVWPFRPSPSGPTQGGQDRWGGGRWAGIVECETRFSSNGLRRLRHSFGVCHRGASMGEHGVTAAAPRVHPHNEVGRTRTASRQIGAVLALAVAAGPHGFSRLHSEAPCSARTGARRGPQSRSSRGGCPTVTCMAPETYGLPALGRSALDCPWGRSRVSGIRCRAGRAEPPAPAREEMAMTTIFVTAAVVACCALCAYGISRVVRRSRERRTQRA
jgi:hypothetical protein